jgi:hypothetical protein
MDTLSKRLRFAMDRVGMSQAELARKCGIKQPSVNGWLSAKSRYLRGENLLKASQALGVSSAWLVSGNGDMHSSGSVMQHHGELTLKSVVEAMRGMSRHDKKGMFALITAASETDGDTSASLLAMLEEKLATATSDREKPQNRGQQKPQEDPAAAAWGSEKAPV